MYVYEYVYVYVYVYVNVYVYVHTFVFVFVVFVNLLWLFWVGVLVTSGFGVMRICCVSGHSRIKHAIYQC